MFKKIIINLYYMHINLYTILFYLFDFYRCIIIKLFYSFILGFSINLLYSFYLYIIIIIIIYYSILIYYLSF